MQKTSASFLMALCSIMSLVVFMSLPNRALAAPAVPEAGLVGVISAIVYDLDNDAIIFEQNADAPIPPASITKVLSMFLAFDQIAAGKASLDSPVLVSPEAAATGGPRMGLKSGETVSLKKLLLGMAVSSGNDASHAVAEFIGGSEPDFVKMMNEKAARLGMRNSVFLNPHGLPANGQHTTARDMLALSKAYLRAHPDSLAMHNTKVLEHDGVRTWNKNPLLGQYPGADGLKSGWIRASGYNLIFTAARDGRRLLAVILGAPDMYVRGAEACRLLDASFMVCDNSAPTVAAALDQLPLDLERIDPRKTGRDAGLLKPRMQLAGKSRLSKFGRAKFAFGKNGKLRQYALSRNSFAGGDSLEETARKKGSKAVKASRSKKAQKSLAAKSGGKKAKKTVAAKHGNKKVKAQAAKSHKATAKSQRHAARRGKAASRG